MSELTQDARTRHLFARLDIVIVDLEEQQRHALDIKKLSDNHAAAIGEIKARLMGIREELRPILDSSAPKEIW